MMSKGAAQGAATRHGEWHGLRAGAGSQPNNRGGHRAQRGSQLEHRQSPGASLQSHDASSNWKQVAAERGGDWGCLVQFVGARLARVVACARRRLAGAREGAEGAV